MMVSYWTLAGSQRGGLTRPRSVRRCRALTTGTPEGRPSKDGYAGMPSGSESRSGRVSRLTPADGPRAPAASLTAARPGRYKALLGTRSPRLPEVSRHPMSEPARGTYAFVSLGCPKNLVDSERMLGKLSQAGYTLTPDAAGADVVVVNTCGFIEPARQESLGVIREMLALKGRGQVGAVVVAGCLAERKGDALLEEVPGVDQIVGVFGREEIVSVVDRSLTLLPLAPRGRGVRGEGRDEQRSLFRPAPVKALEDTARLRVTPRHYAYLKISEGCDRLCTFCAIPGMRGKHVTKPIEEVVRE